MAVNEKLIFDIGLHKGEDTSYYLEMGYKVVAIEANPTLANECRKKFADDVAKGNLTIINAGIGNTTGVMPFYINLHSSEWSSFDKAIGTRNNTKYEVIDVSCIRAKSLFEQYGVPYYLKVDIEGYDFLVLNDIPDVGPKPPYVSCEANDVEWLDILYKKGYKKFKLINQANNFKPFNLARESNKLYVMYRKIKHAIKHKLRNIGKSKYVGGSSGPFAENTKGKWRTYEEVRQAYVDYNQGDLKTPINYISWLDFHAAF
jgi:FkbM family methyltransferase